MVDERVAGVILAGGRSSRMAGLSGTARDFITLPKARQSLGGDLLIDRVAARLRPQVSMLLINANDTPAAYRHLGAPVVADLTPDYPGPLAGLLAAMEYVRRHVPHIELVALAPCDAPFLPDNLVTVLIEALEAEAASVACPRYQGFLQPTFSLWRADLLPLLHHELTALGKGGFKDLLRNLDCAQVEWSSEPVDPFYNINTPHQLEEAQRLIVQGTST